ncbi:hypothetical protein EON65_35085 [archaeon]|nr:MAG: hypothetical protein EON65_35085 [archaeon]
MSTSRPTSARQRVSGGSKKEKLGPYQSPFIAKAQARALERAKVVNKHLPRSGFIKNEWDEKPKSPGGLFDPSIRKKEIFKLEPRNALRAEGRRTRDIDISEIGRDSQNSHQHDSSNDRPQTAPPRMTVRTQDVSVL